MDTTTNTNMNDETLTMSLVKNPRNYIYQREIEIAQICAKNACVDVIEHLKKCGTYDEKNEDFKKKIKMYEKHMIIFLLNTRITISK
jgi:hypothetical protein